MCLKHFEKNSPAPNRRQVFFRNENREFKLCLHCTHISLIKVDTIFIPLCPKLAYFSIFVKKMFVCYEATSNCVVKGVIFLYLR
jgi:hypothetical protein